MICAECHGNGYIKTPLSASTNYELFPANIPRNDKIKARLNFTSNLRARQCVRCDSRGEIKKGVDDINPRPCDS